MQIKRFIFNFVQENCYVIYDETKECAVIDAGCLTSIEQQQLSQFIQDQGLVIKYLLNTHLHFDHIFGNAYIYDTYGIKPMAHRADEFLIESMPQQLALFGYSIDVPTQLLGGYLDEKDSIHFGHITLKILHIPGHSPGSLCFYSSESRVLFSGDVLFQGSIGRTDLPGGNHELLVDGILKKILLLPDNTIIYPGHGGETTLLSEKTYNPYF